MEKWPFLYQNDGLTPLEKCQFFDFLNVFFYSLERCFFVLEYRKRRFPGLYCLKKKVGKMAVFRPKPWINPFEKLSIFRFFCTSFFVSLERRFFVLEYRKGHFPMLYCRQKKDGKMVVFGPKPWVNPVGKMSIFRLFEVLVFFGLERCFFVPQYRKRRFPGLCCLKKKVGKMAIFGLKP